MCDDLADREKRRVHTSQRPTRCSSRSHEPKLPGIYLNNRQPGRQPAPTITFAHINVISR